MAAMVGGRSILTRQTGIVRLFGNIPRSYCSDSFAEAAVRGSTIVALHKISIKGGTVIGCLQNPAVTEENFGPCDTKLESVFGCFKTDKPAQPYQLIKVFNDNQIAELKKKLQI